jgi:hypothetical protein
MARKENASSRQTLATAYHEAGHAVVAQHLGRGVRLIELTPGNEERAGRCHLHRLRRDPDEGMNDRDLLSWAVPEILISLAGQLAEARFKARNPIRWTHHGDDSNAIDYALKVTQGSTDEATALCSWLFLRARGMVWRDAIWRRIVAVAEELASSGKLTGAEVRRIGKDALLRLIRERAGH